MADSPEVLIYMRSIQLDVVIPEEHVFDFKKKFGWEFATPGYEGGRQFRSVDSDRYHPNGWHIEVTMLEDEEKRFYDFLRQFCNEKNLKFREPPKREVRGSGDQSPWQGGGTRLRIPDC